MYIRETEYDDIGGGGSIRLRIGISGDHMRTRQSKVGFRKILGIFLVTAKQAAPQRAQLQGIGW
jgi:hypothetical protein